MIRRRPGVVLCWGLFVVSILLALLLIPTDEAFQIGTTSPIRTSTTTIRPLQPQSSSSSSSALWGKAKRGRLGSILEEDGGIAPSLPSASKRNPSRKAAAAAKKKQAGGAASKSTSISPDLAKFMQQKGDDDNNNGDDESSATTMASTDSTPISTRPVDSDDDDDDESASTFTEFASETSSSKKKKKSQPQRVKQSVRQRLDAARAATASAVVDELEAAVAAAGDATMVAKIVAQLRRLPVGDSLTYKALKKPADYRLLWAGSQEAVSAVGTGLFNVPLARLQEVFLCVNPNRQLQWLEVIRILGPFPNVRNTLTGNLQKNAPPKMSSNNKWKIAWDSLIDGTGKEVYADELRHVDWHVYYVDEPILVIVVTTTADSSSSSDGTDLLGNPENILVFVREDDLDDKLERYRVS